VGLSHKIGPAQCIFHTLCKKYDRHKSVTYIWRADAWRFIEMRNILKKVEKCDKDHVFLSGIAFTQPFPVAELRGN